MMNAIAIIAAATVFVQNDRAGIEHTKSELLRHLNHDPNSSVSPMHTEPFRSEPLDEETLKSFGADFKVLSGGDGFSSVAIVKERIPEEELVRPIAPGQETWPAILIGEGEDWKSIVRTPFVGSSWIYAARSTDGKTLIGMVDNHVESPGWHLPLLRSDDGGRTWWHIANVRKPTYMSSLIDATFDFNTNRGILVIRCSDVDSMTGTRMRVRCTTRTNDGGRTWSRYEFDWDTIRDGGIITVYPESKFDK